MIRSETEYKIAVRRLSEQSERLKQQATHLHNTDLTKDEIKRLLDPVRCFHDRLKEEVQSYQRLKRDEFDKLLQDDQSH